MEWFIHFQTLHMYHAVLFIYKIAGPSSVNMQVRNIQFIMSNASVIVYTTIRHVSVWSSSLCWSSLLCWSSSSNHHSSESSRASSKEMPICDPSVCQNLVQCTATWWRSHVWRCQFITDSCVRTLGAFYIISCYCINSLQLSKHTASFVGKIPIGPSQYLLIAVRFGASVLRCLLSRPGWASVRLVQRILYRRLSGLYCGDSIAVLYLPQAYVGSPSPLVRAINSSTHSAPPPFCFATVCTRGGWKLVISDARSPN